MSNQSSQIDSAPLKGEGEGNKIIFMLFFLIIFNCLPVYCEILDTLSIQSPSK